MHFFENGEELISIDVHSQLLFNWLRIVNIHGITKNWIDFIIISNINGGSGAEPPRKFWEFEPYNMQKTRMLKSSWLYMGLEGGRGRSPRENFDISSYRIWPKVFKIAMITHKGVRGRSPRENFDFTISRFSNVIWTVVTNGVFFSCRSFGSPLAKKYKGVSLTFFWGNLLKYWSRKTRLQPHVDQKLKEILKNKLCVSHIKIHQSF